MSRIQDHLLGDVSEEAFWLALPESKHEIHHEENSHRRKMQKLIDTRQRIDRKMHAVLGNAAKYETSIQQIESEAWKEEIRRELIPTYPTLVNLALTEGGPVLKWIDPARIENFILRERMALLELAVWKSFVIVNALPMTLKSSLDVFAFFKEGWKKHKSEYRKDGSILVVVRGVLPFLKEKDNTSNAST